MPSRLCYDGECDGVRLLTAPTATTVVVISPCPVPGWSDERPLSWPPRWDRLCISNLIRADQYKPRSECHG